MCLLGKVHGSLARAGKVKGQTPKVGNIVIILVFVFSPDYNVLSKHDY